VEKFQSLAALWTAGPVKFGANGLHSSPVQAPEGEVQERYPRFVHFWGSLSEFFFKFGCKIVQFEDV